MTLPNPFDADSFTLPSCRLARFDPAHAAETAARLVEIDPWKSYGARAPSFAERLAEEDASCFKFSIMLGPERAGIVAVRYPWLLGPYLELLAIWPEHQGRGLGREVLNWLESPAGAGFKNVWICVTSLNSRARNFYASGGYREVAPLADLVRKGFDEILLRKAVG